MFTLIDYFIRLIRLRAQPQDLPASAPMLVLLMLFAIAVGTLNGIGFLGGLRDSLLLNILDAGITMGLLWGTLWYSGKSPRLLQTAAAFFGASGLLVSGILIINQTVNISVLRVPGLFLLLLLTIWSQVVYGHILRYALEIRLSSGIYIALGFSVVSIVIINQFVTTA